jgi:hypothetical protein
MEVKKFVIEDINVIKGFLEIGIDKTIKRLADVALTLKNVAKVGRVEISCKKYEFDFYVIFTKDDEEGFYICDDCELYTFEEYSNLITDMYSETMANKLLDIIYSDKFLVEEEKLESIV